MSAKFVEVYDAAGNKMARILQTEDGTHVPTLTDDADVGWNIIKNVADIPLRSDDVLLHTFPKCGTHWGFEILSMLLQGSTERKPTQKAELMLEFWSQEKIDTMTSPRILNTHMPIRFLPKQLKEKTNKILLVMRNPKDVAVSLYYQIKGAKDNTYNGEFKDYLQQFMNENVVYGGYFNHVLEWEKAMTEGVYDVHMTFFEDLKENGVEEIKKIATFLEVDADEDLCKGICDACSFERMKVEKRHPKQLIEMTFRPGHEFYRKGMIGDWKNHFTVAESEAFDQLMEEKLASSKLKSKLKFEPTSKRAL